MAELFLDDVKNALYEEAERRRDKRDLNRALRLAPVLVVGGILVRVAERYLAGYLGAAMADAAGTGSALLAIALIIAGVAVVMRALRPPSHAPVVVDGNNLRSLPLDQLLVRLGCGGVRIAPSVAPRE
jgi:hypothetical protein